MPVQRLLVVGDAHIGAAPPENESALLRFFREAPGRADSLLVVGDLFEFWFGWRETIPRRAFPIAAALAELAARMPVSMVGGNHDRWGRPFWASTAGLAWSRAALEFPLGGRMIRALHGDGLAERPGRLRWTHRLIGHPATAAIFALLHPDIGVWLVDRVAPHLGDRNATPAHRAASAARQLAYARLASAGTVPPWMLIMGHTHVAAYEELAPGSFYLNPGPWLEEQRYAIVDADGAALRTF